MFEFLGSFIFLIICFFWVWLFGLDFSRYFLSSGFSTAFYWFRRRFCRCFNHFLFRSDCLGFGCCFYRPVLKVSLIYFCRHRCCRCQCLFKSFPEATTQSPLASSRPRSIHSLIKPDFAEKQRVGEKLISFLSLFHLHLFTQNSPTLISAAKLCLTTCKSAKNRISTGKSMISSLPALFSRATSGRANPAWTYRRSFCTGLSDSVS